MSREISDDEYTRQTQSLCDCYNKELSNRMTVLFSLRMTSKIAPRHKISPLHDEYTRHDRHFMTSILVKNVLPSIIRIEVIK